MNLDYNNMLKDIKAKSVIYLAKKKKKKKSLVIYVITSNPTLSANKIIIQVN